MIWAVSAVCMLPFARRYRSDTEGAGATRAPARGVTGSRVGSGAFDEKACRGKSLRWFTIFLAAVAVALGFPEDQASIPTRSDGVNAVRCREES